MYLTGYGQYIPGFADSEDETYRNLKWAAERAVALDDNSALAHRALALLRWWQRDWPGAERELLRTLELNPGDEQARNWYGALLGLTGRIDDALRETRRAYEMDPFNLTGNGHYADKFLLAREYDRAIEQTRRTIEIDPNYPFAHRLRVNQAPKCRLQSPIAESKALAHFNRSTAMVESDNQEVSTTLSQTALHAVPAAVGLPGKRQAIPQNK